MDSKGYFTHGFFLRALTLNCFGLQRIYMVFLVCLYLFLESAVKLHGVWVSH